MAGIILLWLAAINIALDCFSRNGSWAHVTVVDFHDFFNWQNRCTAVTAGTLPIVRAAQRDREIFYGVLHSIAIPQVFSLFSGFLCIPIMGVFFRWPSTATPPVSRYNTNNWQLPPKYSQHLWYSSKTQHIHQRCVLQHHNSTTTTRTSMWYSAAPI